MAVQLIHCTTLYKQQKSNLSGCKLRILLGEILETFRTKKNNEKQ